ncbi:NAD-dependent epimerase/dehydratase family protein [Siphonobacter aquaeclarae]|uniref:Nucleoside-diphosphate-sugar epimerase n=1 Tax=Siphonobacter aquaeclarae TaxID=563176 RepID=A0A1G9VYV6_9BACT|nr:NAD-dependent epimerase/dehydratase family protein [Siphonobacter aquaeclarae]SDM77323.1 Nucleoside-diphosphate-sugar epimerase [Siphonobacter aquaeclarae]
MQTILGAGGAVSAPLARYLNSYSSRLRLVGRNPKAVNPTDELVAANLLDAAQVAGAVAGSEVTYLTAGLEYKTSVWQEQWPKVIENVLAACRQHGSKLVFFDNVYALGLVDGPMTEDTPANPVSKKGEVRARIAERILSEAKAGNVQALIARAPDFYGPNVANSFVDALVIQNLKKGKKAQWFCNADLPHSLIFTPDAARATALLGNAPDSAYGKIWHLPTAAPAPTGREVAAAYARELNGPAGCTALPKWMLRGLGWFIPIIGESVEMLYQYDHPYVFDSSRFEQAFEFTPTSYEEGIRLSAQAAR